MGISRIDTFIGVSIRDFNRDFLPPTGVAGAVVMGLIPDALTVTDVGGDTHPPVGDNGLADASSTVMQRGLIGLRGFEFVCNGVLGISTIGLGVR